ncbi:MAG: carbohydrate kinase [Thermoguttaceae bacterium]|nr:carbohydrate kinase [Thermoguttaceae bacterium]
MSKMKVAGLGELLWDLFGDERKPGGAPANVAFQLNQLGMDGQIISRVGDDELGNQIVDFLQSMELETAFIQRDSIHPTGTVTVSLDKTGTPSYVIHENTAWDHLALDTKLEKLLPELSAVCFGTLAQRSPVSCETIWTLLDAVPQNCLKVCDVNLRQDFFTKDQLEVSLEKSDITKMNDGEMEILKPILGLPAELDTVGSALALCRKYDLRKVCITRAEKGCLLVSQNGETADVPGKTVQVADTVGSGDAFSAALIFTELLGIPLPVQARFANEVGTLVATRSGGMPQLREELAQLKRDFSIDA